MADRSDVVVVGAGPVGFLVAWGIARAGIDVTLIDADPAINTSPRAAVYFPTTLEILDRLDLLEDAEEAGLRNHAFAMRFPEYDDVIVNHFAHDPASGRFPYNLHFGQDVLAEIILRHLEALPNGRVLWNDKLVGLEQDDRGVTLSVESPDGVSTLGAGWVLGTDGARSTVRSLLGLPFEGFTWPDRFVATNVEFDFAAHGYPDANMVFDPVDWAVIARLGKGNLWRVTYGEDASLDEATILDRTPDHYAVLLPGDGPYRIDQVAPYRLHERCAPTFRQGRVLLAGDAAHACNPCGGMGLTTGVIDADALARVLIAHIEGRARSEVLDFYATERRRCFLEATSPIATRFKTQLSEPDPAKREAHYRAMRATIDNPADVPIGDRLAEQIMGTPMPV
jgi:2-polyprenyl-6-methoxyphenol hydroxylase-like FAD-dependent oxidoreductase